MLLFGSIGVGGKGRAFGSLDGFLAHGVVENLGSFSGNFGANDLSGTIHPNVDHYLAFFTEVIVGTVQALGATASEVISRSIAFTSIAVVFLDAGQSVGLALVARLSGNAFRATRLWAVAALVDGVLRRFG